MPSRCGAEGSGVDLFVDVDALTELSRQLTQIKSSLDGAQASIDAHKGRLGSSRMEGALDDFIGGWEDGRKKIVQGVEGLLQRIRGAADAYNEQESKLAGATGGSGG